MFSNSVLAFKQYKVATLVYRQFTTTANALCTKKRYARIATPRLFKKQMPLLIDTTLSFDEQTPIEREIYDAYQSGALDLKSLVVIGHMAVVSSTKHLRMDLERRDLTALKDTYDGLIENLKKDFSERAEIMAGRIISDKERDFNAALEKQISQREKEIIQLKEQLNSFQANRDLMISSAVADKEKELVALREQLSAVRSSTHHLEASLQDAKDAAKTNMIELIKNMRDEEIKSLNAQILALKGSNFSKGVVGENNVRLWLSSAFPNCEVLDKSGTAAESDIHVISPNGDFIAVECKNKSLITIQDVEKSMRDVAFLRSKYGSRFCGYVFVSLRSTNIPRKGTGHLEVFDDEVPIYWYGQAEFTETDTTVTDFCRAVWSFSHTVRSVKQRYSANDESRIEYEKQMNQVLGSVKMCLDKLTQNQKAVASLLVSAKTIQDNNNHVLQMLGNYIAPPIGVSHVDIQESAHACTTCGRSFNRKSDLTRHQAKCQA